EHRPVLAAFEQPLAAIQQQPTLHFLRILRVASIAPLDQNRPDVLLEVIDSFADRLARGQSAQAEAHEQPQKQGDGDYQKDSLHRSLSTARNVRRQPLY